MPKFIFFLDALDPRECVDFLQQSKQGRIISGVPRVTPPVIGSVLTGKKPGEHGLVRPTPLYKPPMQRPKGDTIIDLVATRGRVLSFLLPFTFGVSPPNAIVAQSGMGGEANIQQPVLVMPNAIIEPTEVNPEQMFQAYVDSTRNVCATMRQLARNDRADIFFISIREIDSFTHWHYVSDCRKRLIEYISMELEEFLLMGDDVEVIWFSDHGGCPKTGRFEVNRWLMDREYLNITYLEKRHKAQLERISSDGQRIFKDQVAISSPFIQIENDSKFVSCDAFDACVDVIDATEYEIEKLCGELMETGHFKAVHRKKELYGDDCDEDIPEIIPDRKDGELVSANVHPRAEAEDCDSVVALRDGDHAPFGCYGGNVEIKGGDLYPWQFFNVIDEFTRDLIPGTPKEVSLSPADEQQILRDLERKGYM